MHTQPDGAGLSTGSITRAEGPAGEAVHALLRQSARRHTASVAAYGAACGFVLALIAVALGITTQTAIALGVLLAALGAIVAALLTRRARVPYLLEARAPECRNLIITAAELLDEPQRGGSVRARVLAQADHTAYALNSAALFPLRRAILVFGGAMLLFTSATALRDPTTSLAAIARKATGTASIDGVTVIVQPPRYMGLRSDTLENPARIEVRAGSTLRIAVNAAADSVILETVAGRVILESASNVSTGTVSADADGYIAISAKTGSSPAAQQLIGLTVRPDAPPRVRITAPARDLFVTSAPASLDITLDAEDDLALDQLSLRYTRVSGSGEQFTFTDGVAPVRVERTSTTSWKARGTIRLDTMQLAAGDMIVYRGVAADRRPGAQPVESDTYILEITGPGALVAGGFSADDEQDRYAISQQMLIVETERLNARRQALGAEDLRQASMRLASLQRQVRAEFVFMMGGELEDDVGEAAGIMELNEHAEAEAEDDIVAGRLANRGRIELVRAIRAMSSASSALTDVDLMTALNHERTALAYLQRAFSRTRYILRTLTERERLDLARRLTGTLAEATRSARPATEGQVDARIAQLRGMLAGIATLAGAPAFDGASAAEASRLAQAVLRIGPGSEALQEIAAQLSHAADELSDRQHERAREALQQAATATAAVIRASAPPSHAQTPSLTDRVLEGALVDALRRQAPR